MDHRRGVEDVHLALVQLESLESELKRAFKRRNKAKAAVDEHLDGLLVAALALRSSLPDMTEEEIYQEIQRIEGKSGNFDFQAAQKDFTSSLTKLGRIIGKAMGVDLSHFLPQLDVLLPAEQVNWVLAEHLFRIGKIDAAELFLEECKLDYPQDKRAPFVDLQAMTDALRQGDMQPAISFCVKNRENLEKMGSNLEFELHSFAFALLLERRDIAGALAYSRAHFAQFSSSHLDGIKRSMGALAHKVEVKPKAEANRDADIDVSGDDDGEDAIGDGNGYEDSPYTGLFHREDSLCEKLAADTCGILGLASTPPVAMAVDAGIGALPALVRLASVISATGVGGGAVGSTSSAPSGPVGDLGLGLGLGVGADDVQGDGQGQGQAVALTSKDSLPAEVAVGPEFTFHSVFACPVSRDQATQSNPPWMLPCGHVLCKESVEKIARGSGRMVKCPYCPKEAPMSEARELSF